MEETTSKGATATIWCTSRILHLGGFSLHYQRIDDRRWLILQGPLLRHWFTLNVNTSRVKNGDDIRDLLTCELEIGRSGH